MSKIQTIICLFIFVVIICSMNVFFGITESFGGGRGRGRRGLGGGCLEGRGIYSNIGGNQNKNDGYFFIPSFRMLQPDN
jgi:hypothetical protein